jgi:hypothetical protein
MDLPQNAIRETIAGIKLYMVETETTYMLFFP